MRCRLDNAMKTICCTVRAYACDVYKEAETEDHVQQLKQYYQLNHQHTM